MKEALIIFVKNPVPGKVKTRLAATVGDAAATAVYRKLLVHTHQVTQPLSCDRFVFYADEINQHDIWEENNYRKEVQLGHDLGARMQHAFDRVFETGYTSVCIIGSDCMEITEGLLRSAFDALLQNDVVIGPSADGGYYLLGMKKTIPELFVNKPWSTAKVLERTMEDIINQQLRFRLLDTLRDIDTEEDWNQYVNRINPS
jgi:rSAM/selenodomain-associated transferase 1